MRLKLGHKHEKKSSSKSSPLTKLRTDVGVKELSNPHSGTQINTAFSKSSFCWEMRRKSAWRMIHTLHCVYFHEVHSLMIHIMPEQEQQVALLHLKQERWSYQTSYITSRLTLEPDYTSARRKVCNLHRPTLRSYWHNNWSTTLRTSFMKTSQSTNEAVCAVYPMRAFRYHPRLIRYWSA